MVEPPSQGGLAASGGWPPEPCREETLMQQWRSSQSGSQAKPPAHRAFPRHLRAVQTEKAMPAAITEAVRPAAACSLISIRSSSVVRRSLWAIAALIVKDLTPQQGEHIDETGQRVRYDFSRLVKVPRVRLYRTQQMSWSGHRSLPRHHCPQPLIQGSVLDCGAIEGQV